MTTNGQGHKAADAMDWNEAMQLISKLERDGEFRNALLIGCGCYTGLRISDILRLTWEDLSSDEITVSEKKTGKERRIRINPALMGLSNRARKALRPSSLQDPVFAGKDGKTAISRQAADLALKGMKARYRIRSAKVFSAHSLRKTFGRRVWLQECEKGRGDQALFLLQEVFGHSSVAITRRYLGIRQEEILSVYDSLDD